MSVPFGYAQEVDDQGKPYILLKFTTKVQSPYRLGRNEYNNFTLAELVNSTAIYRDDDGVFGHHSIEEMQGAYDCKSKYPGFELDGFICQDWVATFDTVYDCAPDTIRSVLFQFDAYYNGTFQKSVDMKQELQLGKSSAFTCANVIGNFELSSKITHSLDGLNFVADFVPAVIDEHYWIKIVFSSTTRIQKVTLKRINVQQNGIEICENCMNVDVFDHSKHEDDSNESEDRFKFNLTSALFNVGATITMTLDYEIDYREGGRRRLVTMRRMLQNKADIENVQISITPLLSTEISEPVTLPPIVTVDIKDSAPTIPKVDSPEVESNIGNTKASSSAGRNTIWIVIGICGGITMFVGFMVAQYVFQKGQKHEIAFKEGSSGTGQVKGDAAFQEGSSGTGEVKGDTLPELPEGGSPIVESRIAALSISYYNNKENIYGKVVE